MYRIWIVGYQSTAESPFLHPAEGILHPSVNTLLNVPAPETSP